MDDNFLNQLKKISIFDDDTSIKNNDENFIENDQGLINIIKSYQDYENEKKNYSHIEEDSILFSNHLIQTSFNRYNNLKKILMRKENLILIHYLNKWKSKINQNENKEIFIMDMDDYLTKNRKIIEAYCEVDNSEEISDFNYLNPISNRQNITKYNNYDLPLQSPGRENILSITSNQNKKNLSICLSLNNILINKLKINFANFKNKTQNYINSKKLTNSSLSLLYIFTQLTIAKNKKINRNSNSNYNTNIDKLNEYEKKISKYESCLNEKADIIASRNDRIEQQIETIELLTDEINRLNNKIEKIEKKNKNLNVVEESLCHKCGNSLEESFMSIGKNNGDSFQLNELKKTVQEQLEYIVKMESEMRDLKIKNVEYKTKNEMIIHELEIIKSEFKQISENFNRKENLKINLNLVDDMTQTENLNNSSNNTSNNISKSKKSNSSLTNNNKKSSNKFANKLNLKSSTTNNSLDNSNQSLNNNITNYNIFNINNTSNMSNTKLSNNNSTFILESEREIVQNLKFDNSLLTQEIVNLNRELTKIKIEFKNLSESNKKSDKEKNELLTKFKTKSENYDKIKKENEELMILIQTSNYKSFISVETENKKFKKENIIIKKELENLNNELSNKDNRIKEIESELEKNIKINESLLKFKIDRENLILENAKLESEMKSVKYELEGGKNVIERQNILLKKQDDTITKLNEEMNYFNFNAKKSKQESDRAIQDALTYQQIVRKLEKEILEGNFKKEKVENELKIIKQQLGIK